MISHNGHYVKWGLLALDLFVDKINFANHSNKKYDQNIINL